MRSDIELVDRPRLPLRAKSTYTAEPGSKSAEALDLLANWTATLDEADAAETSGRA